MINERKEKQVESREDFQKHWKRKSRVKAEGKYAVELEIVSMNKSKG